MLRGGAKSRKQRGILLWSLLVTPACGLVVGFEPRELCDDCGASSDANGSGGAASGGGASSTGGTPAVTEGNTEGLGAADAVSAASGGVGGSDTDVGGTGSGGTGTDSGGSATGGSASTHSGGSSTGGGAGDTNTAGGATSTANGGVGGEAVNNSMGGATTESGGMGGTGGGGAGGSGGDTSSTTTSMGGSTSAGDTGSGGSGGTPSPCIIDESFDLTEENTGAHPASLMQGRNNSARPWDFSWVDGNDVYAAARNSNGSELLGPTLLDGSGTQGAPVIATHGQYAYVAYGELAGGDARIVMQRLNPLEPVEVVRDDTGVLDSETAPRVVGVTHRGTSSDLLVAAIASDDSGLLALFRDGQFVTSLDVPGSFDDLTPLDLGESFAIASIEDGSLRIALVPYDLSGVDLPVEVEGASPIAPALGSISATVTDGGAALVWLEANGVYLTTVDDEGAAEGSPIAVAPGTNALPKLDVLAAHLFVSWIDTGTDTLYLQRVPSDLSGGAERPLVVETGVAELSYGLAADSYSSSTPTLALVYSTERLRMSIVTCPE
ncbi:MAG TPA: hypothetical protein VI197_01260 [Polyangiaceae bacterium]